MSDPAEQWLAYTKIKGKDAQAKARREWLSKLDAKGLKEHEQKRAAIKKKYAAGTPAATARGLKSKATLEEKDKGGATTRLNKLTKRQEEMLDETWEAGIQPGINGMASYLKIQYGGKEKVPSQRNIALWLKGKVEYQIDLRPKKSLSIQSGDLKITKPYQSLSIDLTQFGQSGAKFVLNLMDVFSRRLYSRYIGKKSAENVVVALKDIFEQNKRQNGNPLGRIIAADNGSEFLNTKVKDLLAKEGIKLLPNISGRAVPSIERMNQTQGTLLRKWMDKKNKYGPEAIKEGVPIIQDLINGKLKNKTTGMTPDQVHALNAAGVKALASKIVTRALKRRDVKQGKDDIAVGDKVRLKAAKKYKGGIGQDAKFFSDNWSNGVYVISHVRRAANQLRNLDLSGNVGDNTRAVTYKVKGSALIFTRNDVQKVPADTPTTAELDQVEAESIEQQIRDEAIAKEERAKKKANAPPKVSTRKYRYDKKAYIVAKPIFFKGTRLNKCCDTGRYRTRR